VTSLTVKYFDTLPPATSLAVLKTGFLFVASEFGNHSLYQFIVSAPAPRFGVLLLCMVGCALCGCGLCLVWSCSGACFVLPFLHCSL